MKNKFGFILVKPQLGENIGACARSMKNFGFSKLHIVSPKINFPNHKAKATSVGAFDIINKAKVFNDTNEAISNFDIVISLSARKRDINKRHISLEEFGNLIKKKKNSNFGLIFGPERSGFSNKDFFFFNYSQPLSDLNLLSYSKFNSVQLIPLPRHITTQTDQSI